MADSAHPARLRVISCGVALGLLLCLPMAAPAQDAAEVGAIRALIVEAVETLQDFAFKTESKPVILTKALQGLVGILGEPAKTFDRDLSSMPDAEAEKAFFAALEGLANAPGQRRGLRDLAETSLQTYCKQHDPYTTYTRSEDYKQSQLMSKVSGSGIGMTVNDKGGSLLCYPMPGTPAQVAGIKPGDKLLSVEGRSVEGKPLEFVAGIMRGAPGTEVTLRVEHGFGRAESLKVIREALTMPSVTIEKRLASYTLRTRKFSKELIGEARTNLAKLSSGSTLTLDFRGCPGGDLDVAIEFAGMFMDAGEPIVTIRTRNQPDEVAVAKKPREFNPAAIIILQDEGTASAAELVIAALLNSKVAQATSQGAKSYGKGVMQTRRELAGGGSLLLTNGLLIAPLGETWDGVGLMPSLEKRKK